MVYVPAFFSVNVKSAGFPSANDSVPEPRRVGRVVKCRSPNVPGRGTVEIGRG